MAIRRSQASSTSRSWNSPSSRCIDGICSCVLNGPSSPSSASPSLLTSLSHSSCGVPLFSNTTPTPCRNCSSPLTLSLNPRIIGTLLDETGCISPGKLLWSERAWEQLFGRSVEEIVRMTGEECRLFEQRVTGLRCHLTVGWEGGVGRLVVLGVGI